MPKSRKPARAVGRRSFLTGVATAAAGAAALTRAPAADVEAAQRGTSDAPPPSPAQIEREAGNTRPPAAPRTGERAAVRQFGEVGQMGELSHHAGADEAYADHRR